MATMDIFESDAFSVIELTRALENIPFKPATLSGSGLFGDRGVRSRTVVIESRDGTLSLIPFSERGSAYDQQVPWYHPHKKVQVGERMARWALASVYGLKLGFQPAACTAAKTAGHAAVSLGIPENQNRHHRRGNPAGRADRRR